MEALEKLRAVTPSVSSTDHLMGEEQELAFVTAFGAVMRAVAWRRPTPTSHGRTFPLSRSSRTTNRSIWTCATRSNARAPLKTSVLDDIDFEVELIHRDKINVDYILRLLGRLKKARTPEEVAKEKKGILT